MPLYEYYCEACGAITELWRKAEEKNDLAHCNACGKRAQKTAFPTSMSGGHVRKEEFNVIETNFGRQHGGHRKYTRGEYLEMCRKLDRSPDGVIKSAGATLGARRREAGWKRVRKGAK